MKEKRVMIALATAAVILLLVAGVGVMLYFRIADLKKTSKKLEETTAVLKDFYRRNPFPSHDNMTIESENVEAMSNRFAQVVDVLKKRQVDTKKITPSMFIDNLRESKNRLVKAGGEKMFPTGFGLGFEKYFTGAVPAPADVPQFIQQLVMIENLCNVFVEEKAEITLLTREAFEDVLGGAHGRMPQPESGGHQAPTAPGAPGAERTAKALFFDPSVFTKRHFSIQFRAKEQALTRILNRLANHEMIIVVTNLEIDNKAAELTAGKTGKPADSGVKDSNAGQTRDVRPISGAARTQADRQKEWNDRIVCTRELAVPMRISLDIDIYNFGVDQEKQDKL
jgi:hypothetical protein